jgi:hypothetical protein
MSSCEASGYLIPKNIREVVYEYCVKFIAIFKRTSCGIDYTNTCLHNTTAYAGSGVGRLHGIRTAIFVFEADDLWSLFLSCNTAQQNAPQSSSVVDCIFQCIGMFVF